MDAGATTAPLPDAPASFTIPLSPVLSAEEGEIVDDETVINAAADAHPVARPQPESTATPYSAAHTDGERIYTFPVVFSELDEISDDIADIRAHLSDIRSILQDKGYLEALPKDVADLRIQIRDLRQRLERQEDESFGAHKFFKAEIEKIKDERRWIREEIKQQRYSRDKAKRRVDELYTYLGSQGEIPPASKRVRKG